MHSRRLLELDALRGLAASAVVLHHGLKMSDMMQGWFRDALVASPLRLLQTGRPAVVFFFVLSGFVLARTVRPAGLLSPGQYAAWVGQRTVRLCLPALASLLLSAALYAGTFDSGWTDRPLFLAEHVWMQPPTAAGVARAALLLGADGQFGGNNVLWSLVHEWRFSLLLPLAGLAVFQGRRGAVLLLLAGVVLYGTAGGSGDGNFVLGPTLLSTVRATLYLMLPFAAGVALAEGSIEQMRGGPWHVPAALLAVAALGQSMTDLGTTLASVLLIWAALQPGRLRDWLRRPGLAWLGRVSFSLYLVHVPLMAALLHGLHGSAPLPLLMLAGTALSYPAAWAFFLIVERPAHHLARRFQLKRERGLVGA